MNPLAKPLAIAATSALPIAPRVAAAQPASLIPPSITTPDKVESRIGTLEFRDGMPSQETLDKVYDNLDFNPRDPSWYYYPGSAWGNPILISGADFETPPPVIEGPVQGGVRTPESVKTFPPTGYRMLDARTYFYYGVYGISPAEAMRVSGIGSQYLTATVDANKQYFDGAKTYKVTLPKDIPAAKFWSFTVYDTQTRSMLDTPQRYPLAGSQSYPSPAAEPNADGSTTVYFAPEQPEGVPHGNWIQTVPSRGWFVWLRLYSPLESFFDKTWQPSEIELVP